MAREAREVAREASKAAVEATRTAVEATKPAREAGKKSLLKVICISFSYIFYQNAIIFLLVIMVVGISQKVVTKFLY